MRKKISLLLMGMIWLGGYAYAPYRQTAVAGKFYPNDPDDLKAMIGKYLARAGEQQLLAEKPIALISPHAGYLFSGQVAARAYNEAKGRGYQAVIVVGFSHNSRFQGVSVIPQGYYQTPLGDLKIDAGLARKLLESPNADYVQRVHLVEHSVEVQMPFIQMVLPGVPVVPVVMGDPDPENCRLLGEALYKAVKGKNVLIVASTDMSHYPKAEFAEQVDAATLECIKKLDVDEILRNEEKQLARGIRGLSCALCGVGPVAAVIYAAKKLGADSVKVLNYAHSGMTAGDNSRVVGYGAVAFFKQRREKMSDHLLDAMEQKKLLALARETIDLYLSKDEKSEVEFAEPHLTRSSGAFVTLRQNGRLRGCIGYIEPIKPLYLAITDMAVNAATRDHRFPPVKHQELKDIEIEISVLSPKRKVEDPVKEIKLGEHGVIIESGEQGGVFLPQVATETGWNLERFMSELCSQKAGLAPDAWKKGECDIYVFTAQVFHE